MQFIMKTVLNHLKIILIIKFSINLTPLRKYCK